MPTDLLTHSSMQTFKTCHRKYLYEYELGLRPDYPSKPLRMGDNVHQGIDALCLGKSIDEACQVIYSNYADLPVWVDNDFALHEWETECRIALEMVWDWQWRWQTDPIEYIASEEVFALPLINPETGGVSRTFKLAGKIDAKGVRASDGRNRIVERKTTSDDIAPDSMYWRALRLDAQVSMYHDAANRQGFDGGVLYDVLAKPSIAPLTIPIVDSDGFKIVNDEQGNRVFNKNGAPRQSGDAEKGWKLLSRKQTPDEFGERLSADIVGNPDRYYQRRDIPRLVADIEEFRFEVWAIGQNIINNRNTGHWPRNSGACRNYNTICPYFDLCSNAIDVSSHTPSGFVRLTSSLHPELQTGARNDSSAHNATAAAETTATAAAGTDLENVVI